MLISHSHRFIYLKTIKTASTSIEIYFERYCADPAAYPGARHGTEAIVSSSGVIGCRKADTAGETWYNHMPASRVRELIGDNLWGTYSKICAIRNPFDKVVSQFWFTMTEECRGMLAQCHFGLVRSTFREWLRRGPLPLDRHIYTIDGALAINHLIRFESLKSDLPRVCSTLGVPWEPERLGSYKSDARLRAEHFSEYYDDEGESTIRNQYKWEIDYFGYDIK
jgi:hypothetical protein